MPVPCLSFNVFSFLLLILTFILVINFVWIHFIPSLSLIFLTIDLLFCSYPPSLPCYYLLYPHRGYSLLLRLFWFTLPLSLFCFIYSSLSSLFFRFVSRSSGSFCRRRVYLNGPVERMSLCMMFLARLWVSDAFILVFNQPNTLNPHVEGHINVVSPLKPTQRRWNFGVNSCVKNVSQVIICRRSII